MQFSRRKLYHFRLDHNLAACPAKKMSLIMFSRILGDIAFPAKKVKLIMFSQI